MRVTKMSYVLPNLLVGGRTNRKNTLNYNIDRKSVVTGRKVIVFFGSQFLPYQIISVTTEDTAELNIARTDMNTT